MQISSIFRLLVLLALVNCKSHTTQPDTMPPLTSESEATTQVVITIPDLKNSDSECSFIDDFLPTPSQMVPGKNKEGLDLRYYTYNVANYKTWKDRKVMLSFHSTNDPKCWALFEEQVVE